LPGTTDDSSVQQHIHENDRWAWAVTFVVTLGLHVGIVLFASLSIALCIYALTVRFGETTTTPLVLLWLLIIVSLAVWGMLIDQHVRGFRPHAISGLGKLVVITSGLRAGELSADLAVGLFGLLQLIPFLFVSSIGKNIPRPILIASSLVGGLFLLDGLGSLGIRLWIRRQKKNVTPG
jgi:hypothetical protein